MTTSYVNRRTAGLVTAALALGTAAPAAAQPVGSDGPVKFATPRQIEREGRADVLPPYTGISATHYGKANVLAPYTGTPVARHAKPAPAPAAAPRSAVHHAAPGGSSDLVYILVGGAGGVLVALTGIGGTLAATSRRRTGPARARIAA